MITKIDFEEYCKKNNLRYKFEDKHYEEIILTHWNNNNLFIVLCCYGYIETAKWLLTLGEINIHLNNEDAFRTSCYYGHLEVIKWLNEISEKNKEMINIHANNEEAFRNSCFGHLEVAKWLIKISKENGEMINIHASDEKAFIISCVNGQRNNLQSKLFRFQHYFAQSAK